MKRVISELTQHDPIILNSHTHYDHVGGNHSFRTIYGTATEFTRINARGKPHSEVAEFVGEGWIRRQKALYAHFEGADVGQYTESAKRLAGLAEQIDWLLPAHIEPWLPSQYLVRMRDAFEVIQEGSASFVLTDGNRQYSFEGFSIIVPDTPGDNVSLH